jgi:hypothetical protein
MEKMKRARGPSLALAREVKADTFLADWHAESLRYEIDARRFEESSTSEERENMARSRGFRTWRQHRACAKHCSEMVRQFVEEKAFGALWGRLKKLDSAHGSPDLYGPHNGGVPSKLLQAIEVWYQQPKLTKAARAKHHGRIKALCDELSILLEQLTPSGTFDQFRSIGITAEAATDLLNLLGVSELRKAELHARVGGPEKFVEYALAEAGVTPALAVRSLADSARRRGWDVLPPKVNSQTAFRTYLIRQLNDGLYSLSIGAGEGPLIPDALVAELVAIVTRQDCSIDDVRKAVKQHRMEKTRAWEIDKVHWKIGS